LERLAKLTGVRALAQPEREYVMVAAGPGDARHLTEEAREAVEGADVVFGAPSVIARAKETGLLRAGKLSQPFYKAGQVLPYMKENPQLRRAAVLLSGDTGLYSGAAQLRAALEEEAEPVRFRYLPGISSVAVLAAALQVTWEDAVILSTHGRERDVVGHLRRERKVFLLTGGLSGVNSTAELLRKAIAGNVLPQEIRIGYGFNLSQESGETGLVSLEQLERLDKRGLYILYLENPAADACPVTPGMEDEAFARAEVPMTKEEVRVLALSRLRLHRHAVLYDIGAGTGSVSVEAAKLCPDAQIYAVEKKPEAVEILRENLNRYCLHSVHVVEAAAPEGLGDLPAPTHVFIGGSGAALPDILRAVLGKNPRVRIVLTCVTLETLAQAMQAARELPVTEPQVRQIAVSRAETVGPYHMMKAQNPVYIIDFEGRAASIIQR
jgi:precorrin-6Y C5,15-methyltransferase (decarboxylating)